MVVRDNFTFRTISEIRVAQLIVRMALRHRVAWKWIVIASLPVPLCTRDAEAFRLLLPRAAATYRHVPGGVAGGVIGTGGEPLLAGGIVAPVVSWMEILVDDPDLYVSGDSRLWMSAHSLL
jgi:hypothetical protein